MCAYTHTTYCTDTDVYTHTHTHTSLEDSGHRSVAIVVNRHRFRSLRKALVLHIFARITLPCERPSRSRQRLCVCVVYALCVLWISLADEEEDRRRERGGGSVVVAGTYTKKRLQTLSCIINLYV